MRRVRRTTSPATPSINDDDDGRQRRNGDTTSPPSPPNNGPADSDNGASRTIGTDDPAGRQRRQLKWKWRWPLLLALVLFSSLALASYVYSTTGAGDALHRGLNVDAEQRRQRAGGTSPPLPKDVAVDSSGWVLGRNRTGATTSTAGAGSASSAVSDVGAGAVADPSPSSSISSSASYELSGGHHNNGVVLTHLSRLDGLGSRLQLVLGTWALATHLGVGYCALKPDYRILELGFTACPSEDVGVAVGTGNGRTVVDTSSDSTSLTKRFRMRDELVNVKGAAMGLGLGKNLKRGYHVLPGGTNDKPSSEAPWAIISELEDSTAASGGGAATPASRNPPKPPPVVVWDVGMARRWRERILHAATSRLRVTAGTGGRDDVLWMSSGGGGDNGAKKKPHHPQRRPLLVAVHLRRGSIMEYLGRPRPAYVHAYIPDSSMIRVVRQTRAELEERHPHRAVEVHLFTEEMHGSPSMMYKSVANHIHYAPPQSRDDGGEEEQRQQDGAEKEEAPSYKTNWHVSLRDWYHFVTADVLIVGSTFSAVPALARPPPDEGSGLPMTLVKRGHGYFDRRPWRGPWWWEEFEV